MKRIISLAAGCAMTVMSVCSCSGLLDIPPSDRWPESKIWSSEETLDMYVKRFYVNFRNSAEFYDVPKLSDAYSDLLKCTTWDQPSFGYNQTNLSANSFNSNGAGAFECWADQYDRIREVNEFLANVPELGADFDEDWMKIRIAEARFCRAYAYYRLCRVYGGVVLRTALDGPAENNKARASEVDSWNFIVSELKEIAPVLPVTWETAEVGRVNRKAAYAFLSRVALHAGAAGNEAAWTDAAEAADKAKDAGASLLPKYEDVFSEGVNTSEICFAVAFKVGAISHRYDQFMRPPSDGTSSMPVLTAYCPTAELADEYEMSDGDPFSWDTNGNDPYTDREPRFYTSILYNGASWMNRTLETYDGAAPDGFRAWTNSTGVKPYTVSGYYFRKYLKDKDTNWTSVNSGSAQYWILIRYAEVLLNKAEALAMADWDANKVEALAALNEVRGRVFDFDANPGAKRSTDDKNEFMEFVRHERVVELAGEGLRFWDLRRWRLAEDVLNGNEMHGVKITKNSDETFSYERVGIDNGMYHVFYPTYYAYAIPLGERTNNKLCTNNTGW